MSDNFLPFLEGNDIISDETISRSCRRKNTLENLLSQKMRIIIVASLIAFIQIMTLTNIFEVRITELVPSEWKLKPSPAPLPVILMSLGRSGSSVTWDTLSRLTGDPTVAHELTGGNRTKSEIFFGGIDENLGPFWAEKLLYKEQQKYNKISLSPAIVGFQWKPFVQTIKHPYAIGALKQLANCRDPNVKIVFLTRNPFDRFLSNQKHQRYKSTDEIPAHCTIGDKNCIERHHKSQQGITLPEGEVLVQQMRQGMRADDLTLKILNESGIQFVHVKYEKLYPNGNISDASEWIRMLQFLDLELKNGITDSYNKQITVSELTMDIVRSQFSMSSTSSSRNETISNYKQVESTLVQAGLGFLLD